MKTLAFIKRSNGRHWVGDGFPVQSIFSYNDIAAEISPFLLMDHAGPTQFPPTTRKLGVGQHPHRGFETVTIVYAGGVSHRDSSGGGGTIGPGDVQWMTAAAGLIHEEYHSEEYARTGGAFEMIQLWVNLPAKDKMASPTYQGILAEAIPAVELPDGAGIARIIAGRLGDACGPAHTFTPMNVWDMRLHAGKRVKLNARDNETTLLYVLRGHVHLGTGETVKSSELAVLSRDGEGVTFDVKEDAVVLYMNGHPLDEPVVGYGPFVMNSPQQIEQAIRDFNSGRFGTIGVGER